MNNPLSPTTTTGNAGVRLGCCTVGLSNGTRWQDKAWNERWEQVELKQDAANIDYAEKAEKLNELELNELNVDYNSVNTVQEGF